MSGGNITVTNSNVLPYIVITYPYVGSREDRPLCAKTQKFLIREKELRIVAASKYVLHLNFRISFQLYFYNFLLFQITVYTPRVIVASTVPV